MLFISAGQWCCLAASFMPPSLPPIWLRRPPPSHNQRLGYSIAIFPGGAVRAISRHLQAYYDGLLTTGSNAGGQMHDFSGLNEIIETAALLKLAKHMKKMINGLKFMTSKKMDPVTLAILKGRLEQIADDM